MNDTERFAPTVEYSDHLLFASCADGRMTYVVICNKLNIDYVVMNLYAQSDYVPGTLRIVKL
jgi:hypothetical protein